MEGKKEHSAKARLQGEARKAPQVQSSKGSEELKGEPRSAEGRQRTELERRTSDVCIQRLTQGCAQRGMRTIAKDSVLISVAFLKKMDLSQVLPASDLVGKPLITQNTQKFWISTRNIRWQRTNPTICH